MNPAEFAELSEEHFEIKAQIKKLNARLAKVDTKLIDYMEKHSLESSTGNGFTTTLVKSPINKFIFDKAKRVLPKEILKRCLKYDLDPSKVQALIEEGAIDLDEVEQFLESKPRKPYILVNPSKSDE